MRILFFLCVIFCPIVCFAEGTHTFSQVRQADISKSYLDISKIVVTKEKITAADREEEKLCFTINDTYRIDDPKELILLLMEIIVDMKSKQ